MPLARDPGKHYDALVGHARGGRGGLLFLPLAFVFLAAPLAADAQQPPKVPRIGILAAPSISASAHHLEAFRQDLRKLGYVERQNIAVEYRYAEGKLERLPDLAAELVQLKVDVIVASGTPAALAAKQATRTLPIVMAIAADPAGSGLVASLARPGGNVTGSNLMAPELAGKRLQLLNGVVPGASRVAVLSNPILPSIRLVLRETEAAARVLGVPLQPLDIRAPEDIDRAF